MKEFIENNKERILEELKSLLRIKSISADSAHKEDVLSAARFVRDDLEKSGLNNVELINETDSGHPVVYAEHLGAGKDKPIVMIYGHYDVQAPDPIEEWLSDPFLPEVRDGYIYARGATDNKGQFFTHLKALEYLIKEEKDLPVNVKVVIEGEEENGGKNLEKFLQNNTEDLGADLVLIADTESPSESQPAIESGLRGIVYFEILADGPKTDLHSGLFGGAVANPANALAYLVSRMQDPLTGKVLIPGFYNDVLDLTDEERSMLHNPFVKEEDFLHHASTSHVWGDNDYTLHERLVARPTFDVHGFQSGYQGEGAKTIIPSTAKIKVSSRLVPNQNPKDIQEKFIDFVNNFKVPGIKLSVNVLGSAPAVCIPHVHPHIDTARNVLRDLWGREPVFQRSGGSIPIVTTFSELGILPLLIGYGLPDDKLHSPNERMKLSMFFRGIQTTARLLREL